MTGTVQKYDASKAITLELCCQQCGEKFLVRHHPSEFDSGRDWTPPKFCPKCRRDRRECKERTKEKREAVKWQEAATKERAEFHNRLKNWQVAEMDAVRPRDDNILCIWGNGFDLMHNVRSSYYAFRDSIGKNNSLRTILEFYSTPEDIWADFEDSLARFNVGAMASSWLVEDWLDTFDAFDEDASAASFYMAAEWAAEPMRAIGDELPKRFRRWGG